MNGYGIYKFKSGSVYMGEWVNGKAEGRVNYYIIRDCMNLIMAQFMMEIGNIINCMEKAHSLMLQVKNGKENLLKVFINKNNKFS